MTAKGSPRRQTLPHPQLTVPVDERRDHVQGSSSAPVTLVEYGDYQCPYCGEAYPIVKRLQSTLGEQLRFVFRNFPLTQVHPQAEFAAELAEAAAAQGQFWEMHDLIYEHQASLPQPDSFRQIARERLKLDSKKLEVEVAQHAYLPRIREDFMSGVRSGVNGTPTFYINGVRHDGGYEFDVLDESLRAARRPAST
jgi:protein-disulfide isomerase